MEFSTNPGSVNAVTAGGEEVQIAGVMSLSGGGSHVAWKAFFSTFAAVDSKLSIKFRNPGRK